MNKKKTEEYINGLKGIACIEIMIGHLVAIYTFSGHFPIKLHFLDIIINSNLRFLTEAFFWVHLFFVISGYLIAKAEINSLFELVRRIFIRLVRFVVPIFCAELVIYLVIFKVFGMHNVDTESLFVCEWFQSYYRESYDIKSVLYAPLRTILRGRYALNPTYWCLKDMFIGSIVIYILKFILSKLENNKAAQCLLVSIAFVVCTHVDTNQIVLACLIGMVTNYIIELNRKLDNDLQYFILLVVGIYLYLYSERMLRAVCFGIIIFGIDHMNVAKRILSNRLFLFLGDISWEVYSFHFPVMCSVGALMLIYISKISNLRDAYIVAFVITFISTLAISVVYHFTFGKITSKLLNETKRLLYREH